MAIVQTDVRNRLLTRLSARDFSLLASHLEPVELPLGFTLVEPNKAIPFMYFLDAGVCSVVTTATINVLEVGIYGREGVSATVLILDSDRTPHRHFMQIAGRGHRMTSKSLLAAIEVSPTLQRTLLRFVLTFNLQVATTAMSNASLTIDQRLARWLLMCDDRCDGHQFPLTHQFLSMMLAVQRAGVTNALNALAGAQLISTQRQLIRILDREGLVRLAATTYGTAESEYQRLLGPM